MIRAIFQYDGKNSGAPTVAIEAATEDAAVEQFCEMKKGKQGKLTRFAMKDWGYDVYPVRTQQVKPLLVPWTAQ